MKQLIALLTDFGPDDYAGIMKGVMYRINPEIELVDLTHSVEPQNIIQAALLLRSAYKYFPENTIFLCIVDPGVGSPRDPIIVKTTNYVFVGPDNGIFSPTLKETGFEEIHTITNEQYSLQPVSRTFHGRDIFAPAAAHLAKGIPLSSFGKRKEDYIVLDIPEAELKDEERKLYGRVIAIDRFGNLITNIDATFVLDQSHHIRIAVKDRIIPELSESYTQRSAGELLAIVGSKDCLEISVNHGSAARDLEAAVGDAVIVEYLLPKDSHG